MKYILTWVVISMVSTSCPNAVKLSEFGLSSNNSCAVIHVKQEKIKHKKEFANKESCDDFILNLKKFELKNEEFPFSDGICEIKLDSINN